MKGINIYDILKSNQVQFIDNGVAVKNEGWLIQNQNGNMSVHLLIGGEWRELKSDNKNDKIEVRIANV